MARYTISLSKEATILLEKIKGKMHPKAKWTWLSEFVSNELLKQFYGKSRIDLELESIRIEVAKLNEEKQEINSRLAYLAEKAKQLREKKK